MAAFLQACGDAESARAVESDAALRLQRTFRMHMAKRYLRFRVKATTHMQRACRGHIGRKLFRKLGDDFLASQRMEYFNVCAGKVQALYRGFRSRKYVHDFYVRKAYLQSVLSRGDELRQELEVHHEQHVLQQQMQEANEKQAAFESVVGNLHHLISTKSCPGVYNSPFNAAAQATIFGVPVEEHLKSQVPKGTWTRGLSRGSRLTGTAPTTAGVPTTAGGRSTAGTSRFG